MIIKQAEDRNRDIEELTSLLALPDIDGATKNKITREIKNTQSGIKGEAEAAYQMNFHFSDSKRWMVIHDLRLEHNGNVAQIDHLILNRFLEIYVCESKRFVEGIAINEHGEFSAFYQGKAYGIPSPIEQNERHITLLKKIFDSGDIELPTRLGLKMKPKLLSLILIANSARISRPQSGKNIQGLDRIIKNEQVKNKIDKDINTENPLSASISMAKMISSETLRSFAESLAALHQPATINWKARFGIADEPEARHASPNMPSENIEKPLESNTAQSKEDKIPHLFCASCKRTVTPTVANFCWSNKTRFQGKVYCYNCQKRMKE